MKNLKITFLLLLFYLICLGSAQAQIELVQDINATSEVKDLRIISNLGLANGQVLMVYDDHPEYGTELWTQNGSNAPVLLKDIFPGSTSSEPYDLMQFGDKVIFGAMWPNEGFSPTISDGTEEGTFSLVSFSTNSTALFFTPLGEDQFVFLERSGSINNLWKTDGTKNGTTMITSFPEGANNIRNFASVGTQVFFQVSLDETGQELWVSDGTEAGTKMVKDINPDGGSSPSGMFGFNNEIYFSAYTSTYGRELWKSDGTEEGTVLVKDILIGSDGLSTNVQAGVLGEKFYFAASGNIGNTELWSSDGTEEGTQLVKDIRPGSSSSPTSFFTFGDVLLFRANDGTTSTELWKTDGTEEGTVQIMDINEGSAGSSPSRFTLFNNKVYFSANDGTDNALWVTDGTAEGTTKVVAIDFGPSSSFRDIKAGTNELYIATQQDGPQLYVSDGTSEGTVGFSNEVTIYNSSEPRDFFAFNNGVIFNANRNDGETSLWFDNGSTIVDLLPETATARSSTNSWYFQEVVNEKYLFIAGTDAEGEELWSTDGTPEGTQIVMDIRSGTSSSSIESVASFNGNIIFQARTSEEGREPWISDGTPEGTVLLKDVNPGSSESNPRNFFVINNKCYFNANDGSTGIELWVTDGTEVGTTQVVDLYPGNNAGAFNSKFIFGDKIVIFGTDDLTTYGYEVVVSDGTSEGTQRITDINEGSGNTDIRDYAIFDEYFVFFTYVTANQSYELWKSDGTTEGTSLLQNGLKHYVFEGSVGEQVVYFAEDENGQVNLQSTNGSGVTTLLVEDIPLSLGGEDDLNDRNSVLADGKLFITDGISEDQNNNFSSGSALWVTDGTVGGTTEVNMDAFNNPVTPLKVFLHGNEVYFNGYNSETNSFSLWHTDGTQCGTQSLNNEPVDILGNLNSINGYLYFRGYKADLGSELYRYDLSTEIPSLVVSWYRDADGDGLGDMSDMIEDCQQPEGYVDNADDCDDTDANVSQYTWYQDADGDGLGNGNQTTLSCDQPEGYVSNTDDCDDTDADVGQITWYQDADGDGLGNESETTLACQQPEGYVDNADDCDDTDSANQCALGIEDPLVKVYPNPSNDFIHIESGEARSVRLIDLNGKTIMSDSGSQLKIDIQGLRPGTYLLKVAGEKTESIHRIIKAN